MKNIFDTCAIIGPGLIGGSIGMGLKQRNLVKRVIGVGHRQSSIDLAIKKGAIDHGFLSITDEALEAEIVIIATSVSMIPEKLNEIIPRLNRDTIITDVGSTKHYIQNEFSRILKESNNKHHIEFLGAHPIAGSEKSGVEYADPDLFKDHFCVLTPTDQNSEAAKSKLSKMWLALGSKVKVLSTEEHDVILSNTSHLPQMVSVAVTNTVEEDTWELSGGGLKDVTRIAASDPGLWKAICNQNRENIIKSIDLFVNELSIIRDVLEKNDQDKILEIFESAKQKRERLYN